MSNDQSNFGATISSGIQDISALLPLLGTDQCERHSGAALERGYLYAAATPLSIFGSLGIVKTTFVTLLSTTTWPFTGARWLGDAGFQFESSLVAAKLVTLKKNTESTEYLAEAKLRALLDEQYIEDVERVSVTSSGWEWRPAADIPTSEDKSFPRAITSMPYSVQRWISRLPWNVALIVTTMVACSFSFAPYIYLIHSHPSPFVAWGFPFLRALGSLCSIVGMQLALQRRICRIMNCRLFFMILNKYYPESSPGQPCLVEQHLWQLFSSKSRFLSLR
ncbi:hypothetical protein C8J56DRAFT_194414 [Mycena floridula]|nr:hypothetical protein C8J56DRAFT_194414 [Mycena floridula]